jgi:hypothetical protein
MNAYGVVLLIAIILTVLYWILSIADKCVKAGKKQQSENDREVQAKSFYDENTGNKKDEIEIPVKVLSFKRAMHDISNNV